MPIRSVLQPPHPHIHVNEYKLNYYSAVDSSDDDWEYGKLA